MRKLPAEQFKSHLLHSEAVLWCGRPEPYRSPILHQIPGTFILTLGFIVSLIIARITGDFLFTCVLISLFSLLIVFLSSKLRYGVGSDVILLLTNKRLLVFVGKAQLLRTSELKEVQIQRKSKEFFMLTEKVDNDRTIKWPFFCNEGPELLAIELQKLSVIKAQNTAVQS